jgi:hypothetical protein
MLSHRYKLIAVYVHLLSPNSESDLAIVFAGPLFAPVEIFRQF